MIRIKRIIIGVIVIAELVLFFYFFLYGSHGVRKLHLLKEAHQESQSVTNEMKNRAKELHVVVQEWTDEPFLIEKMAREKLQMARVDDTVYFIKE